MFQDRIFTAALLISIVVHGVVLWFMPGLKLLEKVRTLEWLEVELLLLPEIETQQNPDASLFSGEQNSEKMEEYGDSELFPSPPIWVPDRMNPVNSEPIAMKLIIPSAFVPEVSGSGLTSPGDFLAVDTNSDPLLSSVSNDPPKVPWQPSQSVITTPEISSEQQWQITGEVAKRKVIYKPSVPRPTTSMSGTVHIKFWVIPDGTISKIVPILRSDSELERVAMEYFQKWRFEAVADSVGRQSGSIPIRFKIQ